MDVIFSAIVRSRRLLSVPDTGTVEVCPAFAAVRLLSCRAQFADCTGLDYSYSRMPIFEYECLACGALGSQVVIGSQRVRRPACGHCASKRTRRVMSSFAVHASEASRLNALDTSAPRGGDYYRDSRNVGLWAKKRAKQMGVDLGSKFEETVEKARTGKLIGDMT
jgi:putative FmdB family regulatory protein